MAIIRFHRLDVRLRQLACVVAGLFPALASAEGLAELLRDAGNTDPAVLEAKARQEQAQMQTERTRALHWPVLGATTTQKIAGNDQLSAPFTGITGKINVFSAGAISSQVRRDEFREKYYANKTDESRENIATTMAEQYLGALRAKEMLIAEVRNLQRHQRILGDLQVVVQHDPGRQHELVQAESRALQVRMRMVQHEKTMRLSINKMTRYTQLPITLKDPFGADWRNSLQADTLKARHPSIQAQANELEATRADLENARRSRWPAVDVVVSAGNTKGLGQTHSVNAVLNWNFFDRGAYYSQQGAAKTIAAAENRLESLKREIDERSHTAETDMAQSALQSAAAQEQIGASAKVVELYEMQFRIARRSLLELLNAYQELASVEASKVQADNDHRYAIMTYLAANSALMEWAGAGRPAVPGLVNDQVRAPSTPTVQAVQQQALTPVADNKPAPALEPSAAAMPPPASVEEEEGASKPWLGS